MSVFTVPWMLVFASRADKAVVEAKRALEEFDPFAVGHVIHGWALEAAGRVAEAISAYQRSLELDFFPDAAAALGHLYAKQGRKKLALAHLNLLKDAEATKRTAYLSGYHEALIHVGLGDNNLGMRSLEKALLQKCDWLIYLNVEPRWSPLRSMKGFTRLLERVGLRSGPHQKAKG
jgi:tetratricopeptide (TPR) repeat protein